MRTATKTPRRSLDTRQRAAEVPTLRKEVRRCPGRLRADLCLTVPLLGMVVPYPFGCSPYHLRVQGTYAKAGWPSQKDRGILVQEREPVDKDDHDEAGRGGPKRSAGQ